MRFLLSHMALLACLLCVSAGAQETPGPDSQPQPDVPAGQVIQDTFESSRIFPGTVRDYWVYVPSQLDRATPAPFMVFQDGLQYDATNVLNSLIHRKEIPPIVGVFIRPGVVPGSGPGASSRTNRSFEYDSLGDRYARFLTEELLPHVSRMHDLTLSPDPNDRAIAGNSSGGICAFTAAWERPDAFRRVFSAVGSYTDLRGGLVYPGLIRQTEPKPLRIFVQDGSNDLNNFAGNWWLANQEMLSALEFAGYDVNHSWGEGQHNPKHATAIFPDALRWLWRDWPSPIRANPEHASKQPVMNLLVPGEDWQVVSEGHRFTEGPAVNARGEVFFTDIPNNRIHRVALDGTVSVFAEDTGGANGLMFGSDGRLYACANRKKQIVAYAPDGTVNVLAEDVNSNDLLVMASGDLYFTDHGNKKVWFLPKDGAARVVDEGIERPNGIVCSPDRQWLYVSSTLEPYVYSLQINADGSLTHKQPYQRLKMPDGATQSAADGMTMDVTGRLYVTSEMGLQAFDAQGRCEAVIAKPQRAWLANAVFGGPNLDELYVTCGDKLFKRRMQVKGVFPWLP